MNHDAPRSRPAAILWGVRITAAVALSIGLFWFVAWLTGYAARQAAAGDIVPKTNMVLSQFFGGMALLLLGAGQPKRAGRWIAILLSTLVLLLGALTLSEHLFGWNLGIDQLLAKELPGAAATASPNRMGPPGSLSLTLLGLGLLGLAFNRREVAPYLGILVCVVNLIPAVGYLYGIGAFYTVPRLTGIAWPTMAALMSLGVGLALSRTDAGPMALLLRADAGGRLLRQMLPWVLLAPLVLGYVGVQGELQGLYQTAAGSGALAIMMVLVLSAILWRSAAKLSNSDTAHRKDEAALRESEGKYRRLNAIVQEERDRLSTLIDSISDEIWFADADKRLVLVNRAVLREFGVGPGEMAEVEKIAAHYEVYRPDGTPRPVDEAPPLRALKGEVLEDQEEIVKTPASDALRHRSVNAAPVRNANGEIIGSVSVVRDITDRNRAEEALRESEERYRQVVQNTSAIILRWNPDGVITFMNDYGLEFFGYSEDELIGKSVMGTIVPKIETSGRDLAQVVNGITHKPDSFRSNINENTKKNGERVWMDWTNTGIYGKDGTLKEVLSVGIDITERRKTEAALKEVEAHKQEFYRRTILAATGGKLLICDSQDIANMAGAGIASWEVDSKETVSAATREIRRLANEAGMPEQRAQEFMGGVVEAATNVLKHVGRGKMSLHRISDSLLSVLSDRGPGISAMSLPDVALKNNYSTAGTLGMGYKLMIHFADKIYLATGPEGTVVAIEMALEKPNAAPQFTPAIAQWTN